MAQEGYINPRQDVQANCAHELSRPNINYDLGIGEADPCIGEADSTKQKSCDQGHFTSDQEDITWIKTNDRTGQTSNSRIHLGITSNTSHKFEQIA
ncbi:hypothetical protein TanjilG_14738 [Lupinus angustifolius]|nr:hypothetical protein TanjilG_14738 [Lupinus angustifolius]